VERILEQTQSESVRVFVVWEPMLPTDWYRPTRPTLKRVSDSHAVQFWDKSHLIAAQVKQQLQQFHGNEPSCCDNGGHLWDMAAVYPSGTKWGETAPAFDDGPVYRIALTMQQKISAMLTHFERGRKTEVDFINGYVVTLGHASGVPVHMNAAITDLVHQIERGVLRPTPERMSELAAQIAD